VFLRSNTSTDLECLHSHDLNFSNRLVRTLMPGGVAGAQLTAAPYAVQDSLRWSAPGSYQIVGRLGTSRNLVSCVTRGTPSTMEVAAISRSPGSPGNTSPRAPARSAISSVIG